MRHVVLGLVALTASASAGRAETLAELLAAVAANARFEPAARADVRIECSACKASGARAILLGRGDTVYLEVKDGLRALIRPGAVLVAQDGKAAARGGERPLADTDVLLEDLAAFSATSLQFPLISDDAPTGVVVNGAPAGPSSYALLVHTIDRQHHAVVRTQYYKGSISDLYKIQRDTDLVEVAGHWRPNQITVETLGPATTTRLLLAWHEAPEAPAALFEPAGLEHPSGLSWP